MTEHLPTNIYGCPITRESLDVRVEQALSRVVLQQLLQINPDLEKSSPLILKAIEKLRTTFVAAADCDAVLTDVKSMQRNLIAMAYEFENKVRAYEFERAILKVEDSLIEAVIDMWNSVPNVLSDDEIAPEPGELTIVPIDDKKEHVPRPSDPLPRVFYKMTPMLRKKLQRKLSNPSLGPELSLLRKIVQHVLTTYEMAVASGKEELIIEAGMMLQDALKQTALTARDCSRILRKAAKHSCTIAVLTTGRALAEEMGCKRLAQEIPDAFPAISDSEKVPGVEFEVK